MKSRYVSLVSCQYCQEDFVPTRRGVHIYCSSSCRSRACKERKGYVNGKRTDIQIIEKAQVEPPPAQDQWNWVRTGENLVASSSVATVQYYAIKHMIDQKFDALIQELKQEGLKNSLRIKAIEDRFNKSTPPPKKYPSIDAKDFEDIGKKLL